MVQMVRSRYVILSAVPNVLKRQMNGSKSSLAGLSKKGIDSEQGTFSISS